jgi:acetylornithine/succinyldiaminopimelate/putrescine aminotransferase
LTVAQSALVDTYAQFPFTLVEGRGSRVRDTDGREYWDFYGGHAVALLGHSHPAVTRAVTEQAGRLTFYSNVVPLEIRDRAADRLCAFAGSSGAALAGASRSDKTGWRVFFCNSGAEANENALKLAIQQTGRKRIAALEGAFHGRTLLALAATASATLRGPFAELLCPTLRLPPNDLDAVARIDDSIAAVIVEPILSIAGVVELCGDYLKALRRRCDEVGALLIYDEVQTGMGRLGRPLAAGDHGVTPDMVTLAKGLANGIPAGALLMTPRVAEQVKQNDLGSTFGGGPVVCAAMLAVLDVIEGEGLIERAAALERSFKEKLRIGPVNEVIGRGCLIGLRTADGGAKRLQTQLLERGFITGTSGEPAVLRLLPPINLPFEAVDALEAALQDIGA